MFLFSFATLDSPVGSDRSIVACCSQKSRMPRRRFWRGALFCRGNKIHPVGGGNREKAEGEERESNIIETVHHEWGGGEGAHKKITEEENGLELCRS